MTLTAAQLQLSNWKPIYVTCCCRAADLALDPQQLRLRIVTIKGDGRCMFRAIVSALSLPVPVKAGSLPTWKGDLRCAWPSRLSCFLLSVQTARLLGAYRGSDCNVA